MTVTRQQVVDEARTWINTPLQHQAMLKGVAVDCLGLIKGIALGLSLPVAPELAADHRLISYGAVPVGRTLIEICNRYLEMTREPGLGDLLVMAFGLNPQHFAIVSRVSIYGNPTHIIHSYSAVGKVVENGVLIAKARIVGSYRLPGVAA